MASSLQWKGREEVALTDEEICSIGRKTVLAFTLSGFTLQIGWIMVVGWFSDTIPVYFYWLSSFALLCGGGNAAANACIGSMICDLLPETERSVFAHIIYPCGAIR